MEYPSTVYRVLDFVEEQDEIAINEIDFDRYVTKERILNYLKQFEEIDSSTLDYWLKFMCQEGLLLKLENPKGEVGYRSYSAELTRLLYNLKFVTIPRTQEIEKEVEGVTEALPKLRIQPDFAQVKFAKSIKECPPWEMDITALDNALVKEFLEYSELRPLGGKIKLVVETALKALSNKFEKLSSFQYDASKEIVEQGHERYPPGVVITGGTGSGKTLGFIVAPLIYSHLAGLAEISDTKVILVYPRNALADDQCQRIREIAELTSEALAKSLEQKYGTIGKEYAKLCRVNADGDFGGRLAKPERITLYENPSKILITNADTLHRRLMDPHTYKAFRKTRFVVLDEVHLYHGYYGTSAVNLIKRLKTKIAYFGQQIVLIGASATISRPEDFCAKLFSTEPSARASRPVLITLDPTKSIAYGIEYHCFLKPMITRSPLSTLIDSTSCIIHNRRKKGLLEEQRKGGIGDVWKTIGFADSRDIIGRWAYDVRDFEGTRFRGYKRQILGPFEYLRYIAPCCEEPEEKKIRLTHCRAQGIPTDCEYYKDGRCWTLSNDGGIDAWQQHPTNKLWYRLDNIWTTYKSSTAGVESLKDLFVIREELKDKTVANYFNLVVATPSLEVGIDIPNVTEIILYKAIRSPSAYKQKVGRGGRELQSRVYAASVLANTPQENYYFRHYMSLVSPAYKPIPLERHNLDVARIHATSAILDYLSVVGYSRNLPDLYNLRWSIREGLMVKDNVDKLKTELSSADAINYLTKIVDKEVAVEAIKHFSRFLDELVKVVCKIQENGKEISITLAEFVTRYLVEKVFEQKVSMQLGLAEETSKTLEEMKKQALRTISDGFERMPSLDETTQVEIRKLYQKIQEVFKQ